MYIAACVIVFVLAYVLNIVTISVGYHRGLAHGAVHMGARAKRALLALGPWVTGLDPKAWVVMHRLHHAHSDTALDPHSPVQVGLLGVVRAQLRSYERVIIGLAKRDPAVTRFAADLNFDLSWSVRRPGRWFVPYLVHGAIAVVVAVVVGPLLGVAWFAGMMSHPVQGALVNALGHAVGAQNFENGDNSRNNLLTAWLILGEGLQNNHHHAPASARFSYAPHEVDPGWAVCLVLDALGVVEVQHSSVLPRLRVSETAAVAAG